MPFHTVRLDDIEPIAVAGVNWLPLRHTLGVRALGVNAYTGSAGEDVIEEHTEKGSGHEELYVVVSGRARFELDGEVVDAPAGTVVHLPDPGTLRHAVAAEDGTTILAVGGKPGEGYEVSPWEWRFRAEQPRAAGDLARAEAILREGLEANPGDPVTLYDLACVLARAGRDDEAIGHLREAAAARPDVHEWAADDRDLDSLRERPDFPG
jgi:quercetin dioxygenase-like cupin family protein